MSQDEITVVVEVEDIEVTVDPIVDVEIILDPFLDVVVAVSDNTQVQDLTIESPEVTFEVEKLPNIDFVVDQYSDVVVVAAGNLGSQGPPGKEGPIGPPGPPSTIPGPPGPGASTYIFTQGIPSTIWTITHNLGFWPSVTVIDSGGSVIDPDIVYNTNNRVTLTFGSATTGKAYLNPGAG